MEKSPRRFLFIASIGNIQAPYRHTRHSAGHLLLDAVTPLLPARLAPAPFYTSWYSPAYMNESGPRLVRQLQKWAAKQGETVRLQTAPMVPPYPTTLVILHDELEAPLGKIRVKRGGPEQASLRGHRGLISVLETLRLKRMYPSAREGGRRPRQDAPPMDLSILRVGVGIGRPPTREKGAVADYVLEGMSDAELAAVHRAAAPVVELLAEELYREDSGGL
ncbi:hypothetical protein NUU61_009623 [Penicillium alfredii]|uniref:Peptidyl-tRNA hydrolase n=1 Tax=Penicillium alfredii TaxID=1506179 RepID=A0A9W9JTC0_9EURO|nr:uncharacterized protein NUU61_009623 [Penicillium alfredii]KAJ5081359.1 hypothetical protein NUU61_009623 [Penicillium alfredii]